MRKLALGVVVALSIVAGPVFSGVASAQPGYVIEPGSMWTFGMPRVPDACVVMTFDSNAASLTWIDDFGDTGTYSNVGRSVLLEFESVNPDGFFFAHTKFAGSWHVAHGLGDFVGKVKTHVGRVQGLLSPGASDVC
jgi:hypothetical protein